MSSVLADNITIRVWRHTPSNKSCIVHHKQVSHRHKASHYIHNSSLTSITRAERIF